MKDTGISQFCRMCGPGGTTIKFFATQNGLELVWEHENLPYETSDGIDPDEFTRASDRHNVTTIPWEEVHKLAKMSIPYIGK